MLDETLKECIQNFQVFLVCVGMYQQVINVNDDIRDSFDHRFHESLKLAGQPSRPIGEVIH
jgi:hypothetical protein